MSDAQDEYIQDLHYRVNFLLRILNELTPFEDGGFTFPDGDFWVIVETK